jgi:hypothetical protein
MNDWQWERDRTAGGYGRDVMEHFRVHLLPEDPMDLLDIVDSEGITIKQIPDSGVKERKD